MISQLRYVPDWSVVELGDGRVGIKAHWTQRGKAVVKVSDSLAVELASTDEVTVLAYPAQTAAVWVAARNLAQSDQP